MVLGKSIKYRLHDRIYLFISSNIEPFLNSTSIIYCTVVVMKMRITDRVDRVGQIANNDLL